MLSEGDIFYTHHDNQYHIYKLLVNDEAFTCYHVLTYAAQNNVPSVDDIKNLEVVIYHSPIDSNGFKGTTRLANTPVTAADLVGYHEYLRQTQPPAYYVPIANGYYKAGYKLTNEKKHQEAIDSYSKAIDLFPQFFEAIDNRAFCKMDLGLYPEAIEDFRLSLQQKPDSLLAEFSIGECYFKMKDFHKAKIHFESAHQIDPNHQAPKQFIDKVNAIIKE